MQSKFSVLKRDALTRNTKRWMIAAIVLIVAGIVIAMLPDSTVTYYYSTEDGSVKLMREDGVYFLNGEKLIIDPEVPSGNDLHALDFVQIIFGLLLFATGLVILTRTNSNVGLYVRKLVEKRKNRGKRIIAQLDIPSAPAGIIGLRAWSLTKAGMLKSINQGAVWPSSKVKSDGEPQKGNFSGVYAYRLGTSIDSYGFESYSRRAWGIVCLTGSCVGHADYTVRGESCIILALVTDKEANAEKLREHYDCPVLVSSEPTKTISDWVISSQGIFWLQHNESIIDKGKLAGLEQDILELPAYKEFLEASE